MPGPIKSQATSISVILLGLLTLLAPATVEAQQEVMDDEAIIDQTGVDEGDPEEEKQAGESAFRSFDEVQIQRVRPDEIPDFRPGLPAQAPSRMEASDLPRTLSGEQLEKVSRRVAESTVEIIAVQIPPRPYRQTKMIYRGHGLWISGSDTGQDPVLVSTADWLEGAVEIYAVAGEVSQALSRGGLELGGHRPQPLADVMADRGDVIERHRDDLVRLQVSHSNRHVNLARLDIAEEEEKEFSPPAQGLVLHDMEAIMPGAIFGYSPAVGNRVTPVAYGDNDDLEREYSFYFLVNFRAILGAPIVTTEGRLLGINALRYPEDPAQSLAIPPGAIHAFMGTDDDGEP